MDLSFLDQENRSDVLREFAKVAILDAFRVRQENAELKKAQQVEAEQIRLSLQDKLVKLQAMLFGKGREKVGDQDLRPRRTNDVLAHGDSLNPAPEPKKKKTAKDRNLAVRDVLHAMSENELQQEAALRGYPEAKASAWKELPGLYDESSEITIIERVYQKLNHKRKKYLFKPSIGTDKEIIATAKGPDKLFPKAGYSAEFVIAVTCDKFQYHVPLNRQIEQMEQKGLTGVTAKTLYSLTEALSDHARRAGVIEKIRQDILSTPLAVHADETTWPILDKQDSDGYIWTICNMAGAYFRFEPSRSGKIIVEMLKGYSGPVLSDEFSGYNRVKNETNCVLCYCWAHARRNFYEIRENHPEDCREILLMIDELFDVEREAGREFEKLKTLRRDKSPGILERIKKWLAEREIKYIFSESEMGRAIRYLLHHWREFTVFLGDIRVPLSNNHAERSLRHTVLGRKNFNGSKNINGADVACDHYTIIETCKLVNLEPQAYYRYLVKTNHAGGEVLSPLGYVRWLWEQRKPLECIAS